MVENGRGWWRVVEGNRGRESLRRFGLWSRWGVGVRKDESRPEETGKDRRLCKTYLGVMD